MEFLLYCLAMLFFNFLYNIIFGSLYPVDSEHYLFFFFPFNSLEISSVFLQSYSLINSLYFVILYTFHTISISRNNIISPNYK